MNIEPGSKTGEGRKEGVTELREPKFSVTHRSQKNELPTLAHSAERLIRRKTENRAVHLLATGSFQERSEARVLSLKE